MPGSDRLDPLEPCDLFWLEDCTPAENPEALRLVRQHTTTPLAIGEIFNTIWGYQQIVREQPIDYVRSAVTHTGGITHLTRVLEYDPRYQIKSGMHSPTDISPVGTAAAIHLGLAIHNPGIQDYMKHGSRTDEVFEQSFTWNDGMLHPGDQPGLGVELNVDAAGRYPSTRRPTLPIIGSRMAPSTTGNFAAMKPLLVIMGVSGSGKTTVGIALAAVLGVPFRDADELHPAANVAKMAAGIALTDDDRMPWLSLVGAELAAAPDGLVIACSALKKVYRRAILAVAPSVRFVFLDGSRELLESRVHHRQGHFMPTSLLDSQLATLEPLARDEPGVRVSLDEHLTVASIVALLVECPLGRPPLLRAAE